MEPTDEPMTYEQAVQTLKTLRDYAFAETTPTATGQMSAYAVNHILELAIEAMELYEGLELDMDDEEAGE